MGDKEVRICNCLFEPDLNQALISYGITIMLPYYGYDKSVNDDISHSPCQLPIWWADRGDQELGGLQCLSQFTLEELACVIPWLYYGSLIPISNHQLGYVSITEFWQLKIKIEHISCLNAHSLLHCRYMRS